MAHPDHYGPQIERMLTRATNQHTGITIAQLCDKLGCTEGRIRQWMRANTHRVVLVGRGKSGARLFTLDTNAPKSVVRIMPQVRVGEALQVVRIKEMRENGALVELRDSRGRRLEATISGMATMGVAS
jgi:predicted transcriptional regulator